ncbi:MAG: ABC transporter substrate-binding protein [Lachnospiraceae bacterium]|nr:ABC transporter substrate-binding protein [Lachnospiraceae bacterium]
MKKLWSYALMAALSVTVLTGCKTSTSASSDTSAATVEAASEAANDEAASKEDTSSENTSPETDASREETSAAVSDTENSEENDKENKDDIEIEAVDQNGAQIRIGSLKGPTSMGLVFLTEMSENGKTANDYEFTMVTAADELLPKVISGELDMALLPANVASVLYNRMDGAISVIDINTLGVLYVVTADDSIQSMADLKGRTIYMTGKGTTPDYVFRYLLSENGLSDNDLTLEYKSEPTEVAALLQQEDGAVGVLPQPFVTAACAQNKDLKIPLDLTAEWDKTQKSSPSPSRMVTGVTVVRNDFLEKEPEAVKIFLSEHEKSAAYTKEQTQKAAELVVKTGIIEKAPIAELALPKCNITCITGTQMKDALSGYLQVLYDQDPKSVGGKLPGDEFYYLP